MAWLSSSNAHRSDLDLINLCLTRRVKYSVKPICVHRHHCWVNYVNPTRLTKGRRRRRRRRREVSREPCKLCTRCRVRESPKIPSRASWQEPPIASLISPDCLIWAVSLHIKACTSYLRKIIHLLLITSLCTEQMTSTLVMSSLPARDDVGRWRKCFARAR